MKIVDTAILYYETKNLEFERVKQNIKKIFNIQGNTERDKTKIIFKIITSGRYNFINFVSLAELKKNIRISIAFSYSRYGKYDNYELCENEKTINKIHSEIAKLFKAITEKPVTTQDLKISAIDISNQLEVPNTASYYKCNDIIFKALKQTETNGRLYFDTDDDRRKNLDGLDFREKDKKRREANTYFKIYSKRKEEEATGKDTSGRICALRGELTLKGTFLKNKGLTAVKGINRENLDKILYTTLADILAEGIQQELNYSIKHLTSLLKNNNTRKIREILTINDYHIFDVKMLDIILVPDILNVSDRQCRTYKKQIKEILKEIEEQGEIKKEFSGNFERLSKLLKKIAKMELSFTFNKKGVVLKWQKLEKNKK